MLARNYFCFSLSYHKKFEFEGIANIIVRDKFY